MLTIEPAALLAHQRQRVLAAEERTVGVDRHRLAPLRQVEVLDRPDGDDPGVVDEHVEPAEVTPARIDRRHPIALAGHVERDCERGFAAEFLGDPRGRRRGAGTVAVGQQHARTLGGEPARDPRADPLRRTGDERTLARDPASHR